jgi:mono/diheme cytochrome c family protein
VALVVLAALAACDRAPKAGDAANGEKLHRSCLQCHGTEAYAAPSRKVQTLEQLRRETERWTDHYNPKPTPQEIEDLVAYLNRDFYRFPR